MNEIRRVLDENKIPYQVNGEIFYFKLLNVECSINKDGYIIVPRSLFGKFPHVMQNGYVCTTGNSAITLTEEINHHSIDLLITKYVPWILGMSPENRTAEILAELDFYIFELLNKKVKNLRSRPKQFRKIKLYTPNDIWEAFNYIDKNVWYKFIPQGNETSHVFVQNTAKEVNVHYDSITKASQRILGQEYDRFEQNQQIAFVGVGSVNSYIIKKAIAHGIKNIIVIDDDSVSVDNAFRFAFPYSNGIKKVVSVQKFAKLVSKDIKVTRFENKIIKNSKNFFPESDYVFISVDDPIAWLDTFLYALEKAKINSTIVLCGVDVYGNYGKIIKMKKREGTLIEMERMHKMFYDFMTYTNGSERSPMIGNGCGKSISVYDEISLLKLSNNAIHLLFSDSRFGEIIDVTF